MNNEQEQLREELLKTINKHRPSPEEVKETKLKVRWSKKENNKTINFI